MNILTVKGLLLGFQLLLLTIQILTYTYASKAGKFNSGPYAAIVHGITVAVVSITVIILTL